MPRQCGGQADGTNEHGGRSLVVVVVVVVVVRGERPPWVYLLPMHLSISSSGISWLMLIVDGVRGKKSRIGSLH